MKKEEKKPAEKRPEADEAIDIDELEKVTGGSLRDAPKTITVDISDDVKDRI